MKNKKFQVQEKQKVIDEKLRIGASLPTEQLYERYKTTEEGISVVDVEEKLNEYGANEIVVKNTNTIWHKLKEAFINAFNIVLLLVAGVTLVTDVILAEHKDYATFLLIIGTLLLSAVISLIQQTKSDNAAKKLKNMITNKIHVIRDGILTEIDVKQVVPGDIVKLSSGDMIPGDVRFLETKDLFVDQAPLTGESNPVEKFARIEDNEVITDLCNIGFMGTNIISGSAIALVLATGNETYFGNMARLLSSIGSKNSFEKGVDSISKLLIGFMLIMLPIILVVNLITKSNWLNSLIFAITIVVGIMPEMLPVIVSSTLAKGAITMSKKKTIVKKLSAIQTFGQMNILCTDKTGTLTEDEVVLEKYIDVTGADSPRILKHAFLNSYFQTGLKNLIDVAIIARAEKEQMNVLKEQYVREDEIPFDFSRRRMSVVLRDMKGKRQLITKGAVDEVMAICSYVEIDGVVYDFDEKMKKRAYKVYEKYNTEGLRVLAVAQKNEIHGINVFGTQDECNMVLIGFVGFLDPPKESAKQAIKALKDHGVDTIVLTGDSEGVALNVCKKVGIKIGYSLTGKDIEKMSDEELKEKIKKCHLYSKLNPLQKQRIVRLYQENGNTVGYMGDGINDSPPLKQADVGISVDTAVDIAKESADIILLEKDLNVLSEGVINGRKTFTNVLKYIKMAASGNFGNMVSVIIASIFLPFLPLLPIHIMIQNILNDLAQIGMPFDNVDEEYLKQPKTWDTKGIRRFMLIFGSISSLLDILCFVVMWFVLGFNTPETALLFQTGWFAYGTISQTLIIHIIRTDKVPFIQSRPSKELVISTLSIVVITLLISFTGIAGVFDMAKLPLMFMLWIFALVMAYFLIIQAFKFVNKKRRKEWL